MSEKSTEVSKNTINVNLEHVLPRNASGDWSDTVASFDDKIEMLKYIYKLGNLAIMASKGNKGIGSKGFQIKSSIYLESEFETTKKIADYELWSKQAIDKRQEWLADYALKIWRVDIE